MRRLITAVLVLAGLAGVETIGWAYACRRLQVDLFEMLSEAGWELRAGQVGWSGWPLRAGVELEAASLAGGGLTWRAERARAAIDAGAPMRLVVETGGAQALAVAGLGETPFTAGTLRIDADLRGETATRVTVEGLRAVLPAGAVSAERASAELETTGDRGTAAASGITVPGLGAIEDLRVAAAVAPPVPLSGSRVARATAWRAAGGRVVVSAPVVRAGTLEASGRVVLGLDDALQPEGDGTVVAAGLPGWLDELARSGVIAAAGATAAKAVVGILAGPSPGRTVTLPVTVRGGLVAVAGVPMLRLAPVAW